MTPKEDAAMRYDSQKTSFLMVTALMVALAAMLAGQAGARPVDVDGTELGSSAFVPVRPDDQAGPQGVGSVGATMPTWQRALLLRSQALDRQYGPTGVTPTWQKALQLRSEALDRQYGLGKQVQTAKHNSGWFTGLEYADPPSMTSAQQSGDDGFPFSDVTIGIGAAIAAALLAGMALLYTRGRHGGKLAT
jgi:hypothetical protein